MLVINCIATRENLQDLAVWWQMHSRSGFLGPVQIFNRDLLVSPANGNNAFGVHARNVRAVDTDRRTIDSNTANPFSFINRCCNRADGFLDIDDYTFTHAVGLGSTDADDR